MEEITPDLLYQLPKTDLHCHLDGSMRRRTILDLAAQCKIRLPTKQPVFCWGERTFLPCEEREAILREAEPILQRELQVDSGATGTIPRT